MSRFWMDCTVKFLLSHKNAQVAKLIVIIEIISLISDLQFSLAMQTDLQQTVDNQKEAVQELQMRYDDLVSVQQSTESELSEVKSLLSWERLEHNNLVESLNRQLEEKDFKLVKLSKDAELKVRFTI